MQGFFCWVSHHPTRQGAKRPFITLSSGLLLKQFMATRHELKPQNSRQEISVNENSHNTHKKTTDRLYGSETDSSISGALAPESHKLFADVSSKEIVLRKKNLEDSLDYQSGFGPGRIPEYIEVENPFAPGGVETKIVWRDVVGIEPSFSQQFNEGGSSSEKLFRSGLYWRKKTFYDADMRPLKFAYGYAKKQQEGTFSDDWYVEYDAVPHVARHDFLQSAEARRL